MHLVLVFLCSILLNNQTLLLLFTPFTPLTTLRTLALFSCRRFQLWPIIPVVSKC